MRGARLRQPCLLAHGSRPTRMRSSAAAGVECACCQHGCSRSPAAGSLRCSRARAARPAPATHAAGHAHTSQSLPRMLTLWFDFGTFLQARAALGPGLGWAGLGCRAGVPVGGCCTHRTLRRASVHAWISSCMLSPPSSAAAAAARHRPGVPRQQGAERAQRGEAGGGAGHAGAGCCWGRPALPCHCRPRLVEGELDAAAVPLLSSPTSLFHSVHSVLPPSSEPSLSLHTLLPAPPPSNTTVHQRHHGQPGQERAHAHVAGGAAAAHLAHVPPLQGGVLAGHQHHRAHHAGAAAAQLSRELLDRVAGWAGVQHAAPASYGYPPSHISLLAAGPAHPAPPRRPTRTRACGAWRR